MGGLVPPLITILMPLTVRGTEGLSVPNTVAFAGGAQDHHTRRPTRLVQRFIAEEGFPYVIVDLGMAGGETAAWVVRQGPQFRVLGFDIDPQLVKTATQVLQKQGREVISEATAEQSLLGLRQGCFAKAAFHVADLAQGIPLAADSADALLVHRMRDSLRHNAQRDRFTSQMARVLKPGGLLSLIEGQIVDEGEHKDWYAARYAMAERIVSDYPRLIPNATTYQAIADLRPFRLLLALHDASGHPVDETHYDGQFAALADHLTTGWLTLAGVGIHEATSRVIRTFKTRGLELIDSHSIAVKGHGRDLTIPAQMFRRR